ncbi:MAG: formylmethanofuran--tetrahydromethanopterin formyltransferase [Candidatus Lokiarchaeota archaeon]|nr:formylmethanofuran--tetrahydromethanopterin formyltransferase [Candidatus Lokiarchaeota archaeon]
MKDMIENTFCEAFEGLTVQLMITAEDDIFLDKAVQNFTALPSTVFGHAEGGIVKWLKEDQTIDGRKGAIVQLWVSGTSEIAKLKLYKYLGRRIRQGILVIPTTAVFDAYPRNVKTKFDMMDNVGHCGDGYENIIDKYSKKLISIPIMMGYDFLIEKNISFAEGIMGGNLWLFCDSIESGVRIGRKAVKIIEELDNISSIFGLCSAGSKPETNYPEIGPSTNHLYCPSLVGKISSTIYKVPSGVKSIPEIVFNAINLEIIKRAMKKIIESIIDMKGLVKISSGNYNGKLGSYKIFLTELNLPNNYF